MKEPFRRIAEATAAAVGSSLAFIIVVILTLAWMVVGVKVHFSDTWQLTMSTVASQVTLLIAFLLQNAQSRDTRALQLKLDELLRATDRARDEMIRLEELSDEQLARLEQEFARLRSRRAGSPISEPQRIPEP